jgi:DNA-directed RNA polymerase subunit RPC12/RpoP
MMQRSDLLFVALAGIGLPAGYLFLDVLGVALVALALGCGALVGALSAPRERPQPPARKARASARPRAARHAPLAAAGAVILEAPTRARVHTSFVPAMEPAAAIASPRSLRLTGDILRGMQTGGRTTRGVCSRCSATIWLSARRPVKARCPVCGFSRVLS